MSASEEESWLEEFVLLVRHMIFERLKFYRKQPMTSVVFSSDGSAVVAESTIILWGPDNNTLVVILETLSVQIGRAHV